MNLYIYPSPLKNSVNLPPSKSLTHRALICASLAKGRTIINNPLYCDDTLATIACLSNLSIDIIMEENKIIVNSGGEFKLIGPLDAKDSATTLRLLIPSISFFYKKFEFFASPRLLARIKTSDLDDLIGLDFTFTKESIIIEGSLNNVLYKPSLAITSQWASALLIAMPLYRYQLVTSIYQNDYVRASYEIMKEFKIEFIHENNFLFTNSFYQQSFIFIEADYSSAAFFMVMQVFNPSLVINNFASESIQGDYRIRKILATMGINYQIEGHMLRLASVAFCDAEIDLKANPDLAPVIAFLGAISNKFIKLKGLSKLIYKESNRLEAIKENLIRLGLNPYLDQDSISFQGKDRLDINSDLLGYNDHRIIMALISLSNGLNKPYTIRNAGDISKSFPDFLKIFEEIGGKYASSISK